jgi:hypothetical protein
VAAAPAAEPPVVPARAQPLPNPTLRLEPELGIIIIEFRNNEGAVVNSLPTPHQIAEYRRHAGIGVGPRDGYSR